MVMHQDEKYRREVGKARTRHEDLVAKAAAEHSSAVIAAEKALAAAQREYDMATSVAADAHELASKQAHAELARSTKLALDEWNAAERAGQGIDPSAFIRKTVAGKLEVHAAAGMPMTGSAWRQGTGDEWVVETDHGRSFVGGELAARRSLWQSVVRRREQLETGELAG